MTPKFVRVIAIGTTATLLVGTVSALAQTAKQASSVAGNWTMSVDSGPHGRMTMGLTLKQEGTHVSGTFASPHGDMAVDGEFSEGTLKLSTTGGQTDSQITFEAKLKEDATLDGYVSSQMGDMRFTAQRTTDKQ